MTHKLNRIFLIVFLLGLSLIFIPKQAFAWSWPTYCSSPLRVGAYTTAGDSCITVRVTPSARDKGVGSVGFKSKNGIIGETVFLSSDENGDFYYSLIPTRWGIGQAFTGGIYKYDNNWNLMAMGNNGVLKNYPFSANGRQRIYFEIKGETINPPAPNKQTAPSTPKAASPAAPTTPSPSQGGSPGTTTGGQSASTAGSGSSQTAAATKPATPVTTRKTNPVTFGSFRTMFGGTCSTYDCWIKKVWNWAMGIALSLSVIVVSAAGYLYMTSAGDPNRIGMAKKLLIGVFSGLALLVLSRVLLLNVIGVNSNTWNV